uniref:Uncharacterized protein n=1 Tax=viral metagenome TaxID=1070528 RepID=A0A6C0HNM0_9ZZZZ
MGGTNSTNKAPFDPLTDKLTLLKGDLDKQLVIVNAGNADISQQINLLQEKLTKLKATPKTNPDAIKALNEEVSNFLAGKIPAVAQSNYIPKTPTSQEYTAYVESITKTQSQLIVNLNSQIASLKKQLNDGQSNINTIQTQQLHLQQAQELQSLQNSHSDQNAQTMKDIQIAQLSQLSQLSSSDFKSQTAKLQQLQQLKQFQQMQQAQDLKNLIKGHIQQQQSIPSQKTQYFNTSQNLAYNSVQRPTVSTAPAPSDYWKTSVFANLTKTIGGNRRGKKTRKHGK